MQKHAGQPFVTVEDGGFPVVEEAAEVTLAGGADQVGHEFGVVDRLFGVVVEVESAVAEGLATLLATVPGDLSDNPGVIDSVVGEPLVSRWRGVEVGAAGVRTVRKVRNPIKFGPG